VIDGIGQRCVDRNVVPDGLLEFALEPIDFPQGRPVVPDQGVKVAGVLRQLAVGVAATLDEAQAGFNKHPLRLTLAFADPY
jgi:hypothetical protein